MSENVINSFKLMGMGMSAIFIVIIVIYIAVNLMLILTKEKPKHDKVSVKKHDASENLIVKSNDEDDMEIIAVIAAAISSVSKTNPYGFIVRNIK